MHRPPCPPPPASKFRLDGIVESFCGRHIDRPGATNYLTNCSLRQYLFHDPQHVEGTRASGRGLGTHSKHVNDRSRSPQKSRNEVVMLRLLPSHGIVSGQPPHLLVVLFRHDQQPPPIIKHRHKNLQHKQPTYKAGGLYNPIRGANPGLTRQTCVLRAAERVHLLRMALIPNTSTIG